VEALIGATILSVISLGIFRIFRSGNRQASLATWTSSAQKELRTSLKRIHDELSRASYFTELTRSAVLYLDPETGVAPALATNAAEDTFRETFFVEVKGTVASPEVFTPDGTRKDLLFFYQCSPKKASFAGAAAEGGSSAICNLFLDGDTLYFQRDKRVDPDSKVVEVVRELAHNVTSVETWAEDKSDAADPLAGSLITVVLTLHHPNTGLFPNSSVTQRVTARVPVGHKVF
jgi:Tfp pilus assembly protein PilW